MIDESDSYLYGFLSVLDLHYIYKKTKNKVDVYEHLRFNEVATFLESAMRGILLDRHWGNPKGKTQKEGFEKQVRKAKKEMWKFTDYEIFELQGLTSEKLNGQSCRGVSPFEPPVEGYLNGSTALYY